MLRYLRSVAGPTARPALFLDRDGVLNRRRVDGYVTRPDQLVILPGALPAIRLAQARGAVLVIVSNQGAVARALASEREVLEVNALLVEQLSADGIDIAGVYVCPHHPQAVAAADARCTCRKPAPGLVLQAISDLNLDARRSALLGDSPSDLEAARAAGVARSFLVTDECLSDVDQDALKVLFT